MYRTRTPLHTPKTLETCKKKSTPCLIQKASSCAADRTSKTTVFFIFHFLNTQRSYEKIICLFFISLVQRWKLHVFFFLPKGRQTSNELERNMNEGTIVYLTSLLIVLTWKKLFFFFFFDTRWFHVLNKELFFSFNFSY